MPRRIARRLSRGLAKLADGRFLVEVGKNDRTGREDHRLIFEDRDEAEEFVRRWRLRRKYEKAGGMAPPAEARAQVPRKLNLRRLLNAYLAELSGMPAYRGVEQLSNTICRGLGPEHPVPLEREHLIGFARWARLSTRTRGDLIARAFGVLGTAHRRAGLVMAPPPEIRFERGARPRYPVDVVTRFVEAMPWGSAERTAAEIVLLTAARLEEVIRLTVGDVDLAGGVLRTTTRKGPRAQRVRIAEHPIGPRLRSVLEAAIPANAPATLAVIRVLGRACPRPASLRIRLLRASSRAEISPPISGLAFLRNHALSALVEAGVPVDVGSRVAGHASVRTTETHYVKARLWEARKAAQERLEELLPGRVKSGDPGLEVGRQRANGPDGLDDETTEIIGLS